ncbi:DUF3025 domain-containing protein [Massilia sp. 9096]|uniref:DUF3025 domain-containing protein n=1 Tax=Massilia sp. 9096 TaxID=1500894 RepID=UPI00068C83CD|nr:DUF3025 domain-containing protein [Massilia sp. 9096]
MFEAFAQIDWARPWYDAVRPSFDSLGLEASADGFFIDAFNINAARLALHNQAGQPIRFIPQDDLPPGVAYEAHIGATGCVPTRDNLHDFFNGLVWQTFPLIKRELNALQAAQIARAGVTQARGPARDAATIFDENAALLVARDDEAGRALVDGLRAHEWHDTLFLRRDAFLRDAQCWLFGHALMEKLVAPRKAITAHVRVLFAPAAWFGLDWDARRAWIDAQVAATLAREGLSTAGFTPLQVLGVPGWWPGQDEAFYLDQSVFRPKRPDKHPNPKEGA